jgi:hypothetical protein
MDSQDARRREEEKRANKQREGVLGSVFTGVKDVGQSVLSGAAGLVVEPAKGVRDDGVLSLGLLKGLKRGLVGAVAKPVGSVFDLVARAGQGIQNSTGLSDERNTEEEMLARLRSDNDIPALADDADASHTGASGTAIVIVATAIKPVQTVGPVTLLFVDRFLFEMDKEHLVPPARPPEAAQRKE